MAELAKEPRIKMWKRESGWISILLMIAVMGSLFFDRIVLQGINQLLIVIQKFGAGGGILDPGWTIFRYFNKVSEFSIPRWYFFFIVFFFLLLIWHFKGKTVFQYRYLFAGILLLLLVSGKFSGSSLGFYDGMLTDHTENYVESTLLGIPQGLRGDEWATEKPYYFAQENTDYDYYNRNLMLDGCDMVVSAFAPVKNRMVITRPDLWGFLILPRDYAFSFYWNVRIIILFMASLELGAMLTQRNLYGVLFGLFVCFAPPVQWWLSQTIMITIWSGEYFIVFFNQMLQQNKRIKKCRYIFLSTWMALIYIFTLYPAVQVPMGYIFAGLLVYLIITNREYQPFCRKHLCCYGIMAGIITWFCLYFYKMSGTAMSAILNTVYPGKSRNWNVLQWDYELLKLVNPVTWCKYLTSINNCEASQYYTFAPFVVIGLLFLIIKKADQTDRKIFLIKILTIISSLLWMVAYLPQMPLVNKLTLLSFSYPVRILLASGYGFMLCVLMMLSVSQDVCIPEEKKAKRIIAITGYLILIVFAMNSKLLSEYLGEGTFAKGCILVLAAFYIFMGYLLLLGTDGSSKRFALLYVAVSVFSTVFINPVTFGTDSMFEKETMKEIRTISKKETGRWMVSGHTTIANLVTAQGVARVSGTYYYPDKAMMEIIDPQHEYESMWNHYAHIDMRLTEGKNYITQYDEETGMTLSGVDRIVYINMETAQKLDIRYVFTKYDLPAEYVKSGQAVEIYKNKIDLWSIYEICGGKDR